MTDSNIPTEFNVRSSRYFIARTVSQCRACRGPMTVIAVGVPPGHERLDDDDELANAGDEWAVCAGGALLFYVERLPSAVLRRCLEWSSSFRLANDPSAGIYWANHCERCGALAGDHDLFCEPEGAFLPYDRGSDIHLSFVEENFQAAAVGYACEPNFLAFASVD